MITSPSSENENPLDNLIEKLRFYTSANCTLNPTQVMIEYIQSMQQPVMTFTQICTPQPARNPFAGLVFEGIDINLPPSEKAKILVERFATYPPDFNTRFLHFLSLITPEYSAVVVALMNNNPVKMHEFVQNDDFNAVRFAITYGTDEILNAFLPIEGVRQYIQNNFATFMITAFHHHNQSTQNVLLTFPEAKEMANQPWYKQLQITRSSLHLPEHQEMFQALDRFAEENRSENVNRPGT